MRTIKLTLAYDGTRYAGWQFQADQVSVQATLEAAIQAVTGRASRPVASGRTDAGVHALGQVAAFRTDSKLAPEVLRRALNANLPPDVVVLEACEAPSGFHAIRDAVRKRYRYLLRDGPLPDVFRRHYCWHVGQRLDAAAMARAAAALAGTHDFRSFQTQGAPRKSTVRTVSELTVARGWEGDQDLICFEIEADGFLYNMVRAIVGSLVEVGRGAEPETWIAEVLQAMDRRQAGPTAPPQGLFLVCVQYDDQQPAHDASER